MASSFPLKKNTGTKIVFPILDADGDLVTGAAELDSEYSIDGAEFVDCTNEATEIDTDSGMYYLDLVADETDGDVIAIIVKTSTAGAKTTALVFYTATQTLDEIDVICDAIKAKTDLLVIADIVAAILDEAVEDTLTLRQAIRIMFSCLANKSSGGGTPTLIFQDLADTKPRITATCDADGNRTDVTVDGT